MTNLTLGSLAMSYQQKLHSTRIKSDLLRLTEELSTGRRHDLRAATGGNLKTLAALEHQLTALDAYRTAASEAAAYGTALQAALGTVQDQTADFAPRLLEAGGSSSPAWVSAAASDARARFSTVVAALNATVADRTLLGGTATDGAALASAETMLADLGAAVAAETTAAGVVAVVDTWFDSAGGGFETSGYLGSATALQPFGVGRSETVALDVKASDPELREVMKSYALAALVDAGALPAQPAERAALLRIAGERMFGANAPLAALRGRVGSAEAAIDGALARNASESSALQIARNDVVAADPYATAVDLEAAQLQLESLFAVTARLARLNLTEFLR